MFFFQRKATSERQRGRERRRGIRRRKTEAARRLRTKFRAAVLESKHVRQGKDHQPLPKAEWLDALVLSTAREASKYIYTDKNGREIPWRFALERASELAWDLNESRLAKESRPYSTIELAARMSESTVDYLLARCRVSQIDRRVSCERRA